MSDMKESPRYPFTYAYDWLRSAGVATSRADAASWASSAAEAMGITKEQLVERAASEYVAYWGSVADLDLKKIKELEFWASIPKPKETS